MPCSALSAVCLRSSSIQPCSVSTITASWQAPPISTATVSSQRRTSGSWPCAATKPGRARRAYGNSTSRTNEMLLVVPSISVTIARVIRYPCNGAPLARARGGGTCRTGSVLRPWFVAREALGDVGPGEVADPAVRLGEEADGDEARLRTHVEPVAGAVGHGDQVVLDALHLVD